MQRLLCIVQLLLLTNALPAQCLSGNYIIESFNNAPNAFPDFQAAVNAMKQFGVCGPVHFLVREQSYQMPKPVVIPPIAGASADNRITFEGDTTVFNFKGINLSANFDSSSNPALVLAGADYLRFKGLVFTTSAGLQCKAMDIPGGATHLEFESCTFYPGVGGSWPDTMIYAVRIQGDGNNDIRFKSCNFGDGYVSLELIGPPGGGCDNLVLEQCYFGNAFFAGIRATRVNHPVIRKCELSSYNSTNLYDLARLIDCHQGGIIEKNRFMGNFGAPHAGLLMTHCSGSAAQPWLVANNGFVQFGGPSLQIQQCSDVLVAHNSMASSNSPICLFRQQSSEIRFYNNIYDSAGPTYFLEDQADLAYLTSDYNILSEQPLQHPVGTITQLVDWQAFSGEDEHSLQKRLYFQSPFNFLINPPDGDVNAHGTPLTAVTDDLYGNPRNPATPDIGAVEFSMSINDVVVEGVELSHGIVCEGSPVAVSMQVANAGAAAITALSVGVFNNGNLIHAFNWSGNIASGNPAQLVDIDLGTLNDDGIDKTLLFQVLSVNGQPDENPLNDTASASLKAGLYGDISIGGIDSPYPTLHAAVADMTARGICDHVRFWLETGYYAETPVKIESIPKAQVGLGITFSSRNKDAASVVVGFNSFQPDPQVYVSNTFDVTFEHLTFRVTASDPASDNFSLFNCVNFSLKNCRLESPWRNLAAGYTIELKIQDCTMYSGPTAVFFDASNNIFLQNNHMAHRMPGIASDTLVRFTGCYDVFVRGNTLYGGFSLDGIKNVTVENNRVYATPGQVGEIWQSMNPRFVNNLFAIPSGFRAIANRGATVLWHNTIVASDTFPAFYFKKPDILIHQLELVNNCIVQLGDTVCTSVVAATVTLHNNNFYAPDSLFFIYDTLALTPAILNDTLAFDTLEQHVLPDFVDYITYRIAADPDLNNAGFNLLGQVQTDIDGDARDAMPDIGADEFSGYAADLAVTAIEDGTGACHGVPLIRVKVSNQGGAAVHRFVAQCRVADSLFAPVTWTGVLASGQASDWITLGKYFFNGENIAAWVRTSNDAVSQNDTLKKAGITRPMGGTYTIGGAAPEFYSPAEAAAALAKMGMCAPVTLNIRTGLYQGEVFLGEVPGNSAANFIRIRSEAGHRDSVRLTSRRSSTFNRLVWLGGSDYVAVRYLTLEAYKGVFGSATALWFDNGTQHLDLRDCRFYLGVNSGGSLDEYTTVEDNEFLDAGLSVYSSGAYERGLVVRNNYFRPAGYSLFGGNVASNMAKQTDAVVENNHFGFISSLRLDSAGANVTVASNRFDNFSGALGFYRCKGTGQSPIVVKNNMLFSKLNFTSTQYNMFVDESENIRFWHNSFYFEPTDDQFYYHYSISMDACSNIDLQNNLISVPGNGFAYHFKNCSAITCDYNNVFVKNNRVAILFDQGGSNYQTWNMTQWRAQFGYDEHSTLAEPRFVYQDTDYQGDLHISPASSAVIKTTHLLPGISDDLDGEARPSPEVCVGADEYNPAYVDAEEPGLQPNGMLVFPNPATDGFAVRLPETGTGTCTVVDALGRVVATVQFSAADQFDVALPATVVPGLYWINCRTEQGYFVQKLIVARNN